MIQKWNTKTKKKCLWPSLKGLQIINAGEGAGEGVEKTLLLGM